MKTYSAKPSDVTRQWYIIDASEAPLGRLATRIANLLSGKGKTQFTRHVDCGDYVIVINAEQLVTSGEKAEKKIYYRHSGFPGGLKEFSLGDAQSKDATYAVTHAVRGMLPANKLRDGRLQRLKVYATAEHRHEAQKPQLLSIKDDK